jgi:hypothetical protein
VILEVNLMLNLHMAQQTKIELRVGLPVSPSVSLSRSGPTLRKLRVGHKIG